MKGEKIMTNTYWFGIIGEDSNLCGEEFFVEVEAPREIAKTIAITRAHEIFPDEEIEVYGRVSETEAEMMGLDTY